MYLLLKMGIFHCHVSLPEGKVKALWGWCKANRANFKQSLDLIGTKIQVYGVFFSAYKCTPEN